MSRPNETETWTLKQISPASGWWEIWRVDGEMIVSPVVCWGLYDVVDKAIAGREFQTVESVPIDGDLQPYGGPMAFYRSDEMPVAGTLQPGRLAIRHNSFDGSFPKEWIAGEFREKW